MTLFKNSTAQEVWISHWCARCYRTRDGKTDCDIIAKALRTERKPPEWDRNDRAQTMAERLKCNEFSRKPPRRRAKDKQYEDIPMFDDDTLKSDIRFVPVAGWPEKPKKETEHQ